MNTSEFPPRLMFMAMLVSVGVALLIMKILQCFGLIVVTP